MSILIRSNVHLPRSCRKCPFNGGDWCIASEKVRIGKHGNVNEHRHPDCPLVEIPTPHGRLIDADALVNRIKNNYCNKCTTVEKCGICVCQNCGVATLFDEIENATTIIEAEVSE